MVDFISLVSSNDRYENTLGIKEISLYSNIIKHILQLHYFCMMLLHAGVDYAHKKPEGDTPLERSNSLWTPHRPQGCYICFIIPNKIQNTKGEKLQTPEILDKYLSSALFTCRSLSKLFGCSWVFFGLAVTNQLAHSCCYGLIDSPIYLL